MRPYPPTRLAIPLLLAGLPAAVAPADVESVLAVDPGSVAGVTLTVTFTTAIDSDTQTASRSVG
ncbi:MAG: hypothetical protein VX563_04290, partial [Planctomycetota bacterium]|nr:hypothetical protein [Planctomycetota bacterium]